MAFVFDAPFHPSVMLMRRQLLDSTLRRLLWFAGLAAATAALSLPACGARSAVELPGARAAAGGAKPVAEPPNLVPPAPGGAGRGAAGAPAQAGNASTPPEEGPDASVPQDASIPLDASIRPDASIEPDASVPLDASIPADAAIKPACESVTESIDELRPGVMLLVDQSRSMRMAFPTQGSPDTRWSLVGKALFDPNNGVVKTYEGSMRFGVAFFTGNQNQECPLLHEVHAATQNYTALNALYQSLAPEGSTPTGESLNQVVGELERGQSHNVQAIVIVTDGNPNTCLMPAGGNGQTAGQTQAIEAVQLAYELGYDVYVLGISNDIAGENLQQLANAGAGEDVDLVYGVDLNAAQPYHAAGDEKGLTAQFGDILSHVPFCEVRMQRDVAQEEASQGQVTLDGKVLSYSATDGFWLKDSRHLEIVGPACAAIKAGAKQLTVRISCD